jgi:hypothetical protein
MAPPQIGKMGPPFGIQSRARHLIALIKLYYILLPDFKFSLYGN